MLENLLRACKHYKLISTGETLVAAVSGGSDSLAMLHALHRLRDRLGCNLHVATLDHGLRPEGAADAAFVQQFAQGLGLPVTAGHADVPALMAATGQGLEAAARQARYDFLAGVAAATGARTVATAHQADDQAETLLLHLLRGSGLEGLAGMAYSAPLPGHPELRLIRPLLGVRREEIVAYCRQHALQPREDSSNRDTTRTRSYIRYEVLPRLQTVNPATVEALLRFADVAAQENDYLAQALAREVLPHLMIEQARVYIPRELFVRLHAALQRRALRHAARLLLPKAQELTHDAVLRACELAVEGRVGSVAELGHGLRLRVDYDRLALEDVAAPLPQEGYLQMPPDLLLPLGVPGKLHIPGQEWVLCATPDRPDRPHMALALPRGAELALRTRQPGDRFTPAAMAEHTRSLKKWMIDRRLPRHVREGLPLLIVNEQIALIMAGSRPQDWEATVPFVIIDETKQIIYLYVIM